MVDDEVTALVGDELNRALWVDTGGVSSVKAEIEKRACSFVEPPCSYVAEFRGSWHVDRRSLPIGFAELLAGASEFQHLTKRRVSAWW